MKQAIWTNGKRSLKGTYSYNWASDYFLIELESRDRITGRLRVFRVRGDKPEWGNWKLLTPERQ